MLFLGQWYLFGLVVVIGVMVESGVSCVIFCELMSCTDYLPLMSNLLATLNIRQLGELLNRMGLRKFQTIVTENEITGTMLNELTSDAELLEIDNRIKAFEAKGWLKEIEKLKALRTGDTEYHLAGTCKNVQNVLDMLY